MSTPNEDVLYGYALKALGARGTAMTNDERLARAVQAVNEAVSDLMICALEAKTNDEALTIGSETGRLVLALQAVESSAMDMGDKLCGATV